jgi:hypothetical protein
MNNNDELDDEDEYEADFIEYLLIWLAFLIMPIGFFIFGIWAFSYGSKNEIVTAISMWVYSLIVFPIIYKKELSKIRLKKK